MNQMDETHTHKGQQKSQTQKNKRCITVTQATSVCWNETFHPWGERERWPLQESWGAGPREGLWGAVCRDRNVLSLGLAVGYIGVSYKRVKILPQTVRCVHFAVSLL